MKKTDAEESYGVSPAMAALPLVREWNAKIGDDSPERAAELQDAMRVIQASEEEDEE